MKRLESTRQFTRQSRTTHTKRKTTFNEFLPLFKSTSILSKNKQFRPNFKKLLSENDIQSVIGLLLSSRIVKKIRKEANKAKIENLIYFISQALTVREYRSNQLIFNFGDKGESMYIILKGSVGIYKPVKKQTFMKVSDYLSWLKQLLFKKQFGLLRLNLEANYALLPLELEDVRNLEKLINLLHYESVLMNATSLKQIEILCRNAKISLSFFNIALNCKFETSQSASKKISDYFTSIEHKKLKTKLFLLFKLDSQEKVTIADEQLAVKLEKNDYFGDLALDSRLSERNATVRVEEDSVLGLIKDHVYRNFILEEKQKIRKKEAEWLRNTFFFDKLSEGVFSKTYFDLFSTFKLKTGEKLFKQGDKAEYIYFVSQGKIELSTTRNLISLENVFRESKNLSFQIGMWGSRNSSDLFVDQHFVLHTLNNCAVVGFEDLNKEMLVNATALEKTQGFKINLRELRRIVQFSQVTKKSFDHFVKAKREILLYSLKVHGLKALSKVKSKLNLTGTLGKQVKESSSVIRLEKKSLRKAISPQESISLRQVKYRKNLVQFKPTTSLRKSKIMFSDPNISSNPHSPRSMGESRTSTGDISYEKRLFRQIKRDFQRIKNYLPNNIGFIHTHVQH